MAYHFQGGAARDYAAMSAAAAALRDEGGLTPVQSLVFSQLVLDLGATAGRAQALKLIDHFLRAADCPEEAF